MPQNSHCEALSGMVVHPHIKAGSSRGDEGRGLSWSVSQQIMAFPQIPQA